LTFQLFVHGNDLLIQPVLHRGIQAEFMGEEAQGRRDNLKAGKEEQQALGQQVIGGELGIV